MPTEVEMKKDVFQYRASHESIKSGIRPLRRPSEDPIGEEGMDGGKKKSRVLKEVTNNFRPRSAHMKPSTAEPKTGLGPKNKEGCSQWANMEASVNRLDIKFAHKPGGDLPSQWELMATGSDPPRPPGLFPPFVSQDKLGESGSLKPKPNEESGGGCLQSTELEEGSSGDCRQDDTQGTQ